MFRQVSWLTAPDRAFPVLPVASCGVQHRLQLRDSKGLSPFSLLSSAGQKHLDMYLVKFKTFLADHPAKVKRIVGVRREAIGKGSEPASLHGGLTHADFFA